MPRRVQFERFGGPEIFSVVPQEVPAVGPGQVRVRVKAAGLNPVDWKIASDPQKAAAFSVSLPSGNGNDFAGVIDALGPGVDVWTLGDKVFGGSRMHAQADYVIIAAEAVHPIPPELPTELAGCLDIAGRTASALVREMGVDGGDTVLVSAAAGAVGGLVSQFCIRLGARVIGTASEVNHDFLHGLGVIPIGYGPGLRERVETAAPGGIDIVLDQAGRPTLDLADSLGIPADRINTIAARPYGAERGFNTFGRVESTDEELRELAGLLATGDMVLPIARRFPLAEVRTAYEQLKLGHTRGKIVLTLA